VKKEPRARRERSGGIPRGSDEAELFQVDPGTAFGLPRMISTKLRHPICGAVGQFSTAPGGWISSLPIRTDDRQDDRSVGDQRSRHVIHPHTCSRPVDSDGFRQSVSTARRQHPFVIENHYQHSPSLFLPPPQPSGFEVTCTLAGVNKVRVCVK
jgi:hypothetical protein